jgi:hypothetical protein
MDLERFEKTLSEWRDNLCHRIDLAALISRNPTAHKWKATYRSIVLRELVCWRHHDLLIQAISLAKQGHILGAVVLLRSAIETLAVLIYLNQKTEAVLEGRESFFNFARLTAQLMLGSKNESTQHESINILTILKKCDTKYPGLRKIYAVLSESAHPNYDGVCSGYSEIDEKEFTTTFLNRWNQKYQLKLPAGIELCLVTFEREYNNVWPENFEKLELWLTDNDLQLEASKSSAYIDSEGRM